MGKIICDICGTSYQESAKQCPICGCVRPGDVQRVTNEVKSDGKVSTGYTYVKGGRFSKTNVKKRNQAQTASGKASAPKKDNDEENKSNRGLVITAVVLFLAIIGVIIYLALRFFSPISGNPEATTTDPAVNQVDLSCTGLKLDTDTVLMEQIGEAFLLNVSAEPANTSDIVTFTSQDDAVATVSDVGKITAVGEGTTKIVITCGKITKECVVTVQLPEETTGEVTTEDTTGTEEPEQPVETLRLNRNDITFTSKGESWVLYNGEMAKNLITWSSDDEDVAVFTDGKVVAVGSGMTEVHAEFEDQKVSCIIRCTFKASTGVEGNGGVSEDGGGVGGNGGVSEDGGSAVTPNATYKLYSQWGEIYFDSQNVKYDTTIKVGNSLTLTLKDSNGSTVVPTLSANGSGVTVSGNTVKGVSRSVTEVAATYNGTTYICIIRVNN